MPNCSRKARAGAGHSPGRDGPTARTVDSPSARCGFPQSCGGQTADGPPGEHGADDRCDQVDGEQMGLPGEESGAQLPGGIGRSAGERAEDGPLHAEQSAHDPRQWPVRPAGGHPAQDRDDNRHDHRLDDRDARRGPAGPRLHDRPSGTGVRHGASPHRPRERVRGDRSGCLRRQIRQYPSCRQLPEGEQPHGDRRIHVSPGETPRPGAGEPHDDQADQNRYDSDPEPDFCGRGVRGGRADSPVHQAEHDEHERGGQAELGQGGTNVLAVGAHRGGPS